jgi:AcrR family transcriptional regulator
VSSDDKYELLVEEAARRLNCYGVDALLSQLLPYKLVQTVKVSKDTAYRLFDGGPEAVLRAVLRKANNKEWAGYEAARLRMYESSLIDPPSDSADPTRERMVSAVEANVSSQFSSRGTPIGWLLHAAALTASPRWDREDLVSSRPDMASEILSARRAFYDSMAPDFDHFLRNAMSQLGLRPKAGWDPKTIIVMMHCLIDGAVLRMLMDPDATSPHAVAEAVVALGTALAEQGTYDDPRRSSDPKVHPVFDDLVRDASVRWSDGQTVDLDRLADWCGVSPALVRMIFPTIEDLADSVLRRAVGGGGALRAPTESLEGQYLRVQLDLLAQLLHRLADFADQSPEVIRLSQAYMSVDPQRSFFSAILSAFVGIIGQVVPGPEEQLNDLIGEACKGSHGKATVDGVIKTLTRFTEK